MLLHSYRSLLLHYLVHFSAIKKNESSSSSLNLDALASELEGMISQIKCSKIYFIISSIISSWIEMLLKCFFYLWSILCWCFVWLESFFQCIYYCLTIIAIIMRKNNIHDFPVRNSSSNRDHSSLKRFWMTLNKTTIFFIKVTWSFCRKG